MTFFLLQKNVLNMELSREQRKLNMIDYNQDIDYGKFTILERFKVLDVKK